MLISVIIGYFVSIALITTSFYKSRANNYLAISLLTIATLTLIECFSINTSSILVDIFTLFRLDFLFGATLFTYFLIQIKHPFLKSKWYKYIYLPFIGSVIIELSLLLLNLYGSIYDIIVFFTKDFSSITFNIFLILYGRKLIKKANTISETKKLWLNKVNLFIICIIAIWIVNRIEVYLFDTIYTAYILWTSMSLFLWWILYYGVFKLQIIAQKEEIHHYLNSKKANNSKRKINKTTVSKIITKLYVLMEEEELFKDPLLSRSDLAIRLNTNEGYLSQIINEETNKSVVQFVNEYRVKAAQNLLHNSVFDKYSIEAIGMEVGFKSKSAFYKTFNSNLGMSPGAFRKLKNRPYS
ncbi:MAG: helix-turn-helix domain-containing protein [Tenacibaculum sp.]